MPVAFIMPKFDMDQETATIVNWTRKEGEWVKFDEEVLVVETDKVAIDVPAPATGTLTRILYKDGDVVPVTTIIAYILKEGESVADLPQDSSTTQLLEEPAPVEPPTAKSMNATPVAIRMAKEEGVDLSRVTAAGEKITRHDIEHYLANQKAVGRVATAATPAARRLAQETAIALETVPGSGPRGRVQAADVQMAAKDRPIPSVSSRGRRS